MNKLDGKVYIGKHQTNDIDDRYMGSGKHIQRAIKKYGYENFEKKVLHIFETEAEMNAKEAELVTEVFCARDDTYNICPGGRGGWGYVNQNGMNFDLNTLPSDKLVVSRRRGGYSKYEKRGLPEKFIIAGKTAGIKNKGKKHTLETIEKMRRSHSSRSHPKGPRGPYKKKSKCVSLGSNSAVE